MLNKGARTLFPKLVINNLRELPFPKALGMKDRAALVSLVDRMAGLTAEFARAKSEHQREVTKRVINEIDRRIDIVVGKLFKIDDDVIPAPDRVSEMDV